MSSLLIFFFFFNDPATTEIYTLSLHDALPIWSEVAQDDEGFGLAVVLECHSGFGGVFGAEVFVFGQRSEEHTSELQSQSNLVCRLLLEKKKKKYHKN